jgi:predicted metal-binding protein
MQLLDGSAFSGTSCDHMSIEAGYNQFEIRHSFLIDFVDHRLIRNSSLSSNITISSDIEILGSSCFSNCKSLSSISFESNSRLTRIESSAFSNSSLESIAIPRNVEVLGSSCFSGCKSLSSISFESNSRLNRIESSAFQFSLLQSMEIPRSVEILGSLCFPFVNHFRQFHLNQIHD